MIIGITGCTGAGKTTALQAIEALGGVVIDCDKIYHRLLQTDKAMLHAIEARFPGAVADGVLDRKALASTVFSDTQALRDLNAITHSAVKKKVLKILSQTQKPVAIDAIELFDGGLAELCDVTVAVTAPESIRAERLMKRDSLTREQALLRIRAQKTEDYFKSNCDFVLENNDTPGNFQAKCLVFFEKLLIIKENTEKEYQYGRTEE